MKPITKDTTIGEILRTCEDAAAILTSCGMHCVYCPSAAGETLEQACEVHQMDCEEILELLNQDA